MKWLLILVLGCVWCFAEEDTLTQALCQNEEQIVSEMDGIRVQYKIHGYEINGKTVGGYLRNNPGGSQGFKRYQACKTAAFVSLPLGIATIITASALGNKNTISDGVRVPLTITGVGLMGCSLYFNFKGNHLFRVAIYDYNKNICGIK